MKIFIVEDESALLDKLKKGLEQEKYIVEGETDGEKALDRLFEVPFDLIILDIMLPGVDGLTILKHIREAEIKTPVILLTARNSVSDKIAGLDCGADDYLAKPFSFEELMARIRAQLRRESGQKDSSLQYKSLRIDTLKREAFINGTLLDLTMREFSILEFMLYNKNRVIERFSIAEHVWGDDFDTFSMSNFVDVHIKNIRKKIAPLTEDTIIETVRGIGYAIKD